MWQRDVIPGFSEALESERVDRSLAFAYSTELIRFDEGFELHIEPLTPRRYEWLSATSNPFLFGGEPSDEACKLFLWIVSPRFIPGKSEAVSAERLKFFNSLPELPDDIDDQIEDYLDRAFLDAPQGRSAMPYYSFSADIVVAMSSEPFRWDMERTLDSDLRRIFQLLKVRTHSNKGTVVNRRSGQLVSDWLDELNIVTNENKDELKRIVKQMEAEGWVQVSDISPNTQAEKVGNEWHVDTSKTASFSVAMRKAVPSGNE